jgi:hypothetical protein
MTIRYKAGWFFNEEKDGFSYINLYRYIETSGKNLHLEASNELFLLFGESLQF